MVAAHTPTALGSLLAMALVAPLHPAQAHAADPVPSADASDPVGFVVVRENGSGSAATAQRYVDTLLASIAKRNGWAGATGKYFTKRSKALTYIEQTKPSFGFMSFGAYLGLRKAQGLTPVAVADTGAVGGAQYFVITKNHISVDDCKGKTLASNHTSDPRYVDAVISGEDFDLSDFTLVPTRRPVQTIKAVIDGEAECALVDDSQIMAMNKVEGGAVLRPVWSSVEMPAVVLVSFGHAPAERVASFASSVESICEGEGREPCDAAGIQAPRKVAKDVFAAQQKAYDG